MTSSLVALSLAGLGKLLAFRLLASRMLASLREKSHRVRGKDRSSFSVDGDSYCKNGNSVSIKQSVFEKLDENPSLTAKSLCKLLDLSYCSYSNYLARLKCEWKYYRKNERGSKCSIHAWRGWCYGPEGVDRAWALGVGWVCSRARNRWLLWKDRLGRLQWFETGRVSLYIRKPANLGRAYQLVCNGFSFTGLITDIKVLEEVLAGVRFKGAHYVFETEHRLPRLVIDLFTRSNGVVIKVGDARANSALVLESPNLKVEEHDDKHILTGKIVKIKDFPASDGWYGVDKDTVIPQGEKISSSREDARYLWRRNEQYIGPVARYYDFYGFYYLFYIYDWRLVFAYYSLHHALGVARVCAR